MSDDKISISAFQDDTFLTLINHAITRTTDAKTPNEATAILVSLGEMCTKMSQGVKKISNPHTVPTQRQNAIYDFLQSISGYVKRAENHTDDPLLLMRELRAAAIKARDNFVSSPTVR